jgi:hypothetical protein
MKSVAGMRKTKYRGLRKLGWAFTFRAAAYNIIRIPKMIGASSQTGRAQDGAAPGGNDPT